MTWKRRISTHNAKWPAGVSRYRWEIRFGSMWHLFWLYIFVVSALFAPAQFKMQNSHTPERCAVQPDLLAVPARIRCGQNRIFALLSHTKESLSIGLSACVLVGRCACPYICSVQRITKTKQQIPPASDTMKHSLA